MSLEPKHLKVIIRELAENFVAMAKVFGVLGYIVKKADKEGLLDSLDTFDLGKLEGRTLELEDKKGVCPHDLPDNTCWQDLGHGFSKCLVCNTIKQDETATTTAERG